MANGLSFERIFSEAGAPVLNTVEWSRRDASITGVDGTQVFFQSDVEAPRAWSDQAVRVAASKYFSGQQGRAEREASVRTLFERVVNTIVHYATESPLFSSPDEVTIFGDELAYLLVHQHASFNSPVWFNVGIEEKPQCSACFINSVEDSMESILELAKTEGMLFKHGSGTGTNLSVLRGSREPLSRGGTASGPVSFMRGFDSFAGVIKSGGRTRRAAKMVVLDADHPDIFAFVESKAREEKKAWALIEAGYDGSIDGEAYGSVMFQNANHSVRLNHALLEAAARGASWFTIRRLDGEVAEEFPARDLLHAMAKAAWICGDPGVQYDDTIQRWHTCKASGPIRASNPCSEYMFLDDTACNLASLNLMAFVDTDGEFEVERFRQAVRVIFTAQELLVSRAGYPTARIAANSERFRPLGLGYANLGGVLMRMGLPYDSDNARLFAGTVTALMTGAAYAWSARMARTLGAFEGFKENRASMLEVIRLHADAAQRLEPTAPLKNLHTVAVDEWKAAIDIGSEYGFRNAQASVIAPTGTIGLLMDCDTMGIEPDIALVKYKRLVGGGMFKMVNRVVPRALEKLGYSVSEREAILRFLEENDTVEGAPGLNAEHLAVFDCAFAHGPSGRTISPAGHLKMMAAVQPFVSGAISKTVNLPNDATTEDIERVFLQGAELGLKAVAVYRDGCKRVQPLATKHSQPGQLAFPRVTPKEVAGLTPPCPNCGNEQIRSGSCFVCTHCGETTACA